MYYELYIDAFFLVNFTMNYLLLRLVRQILKCPATHGRICLGAALGALCTCIVMVIPGIGAFVRILLFHTVLNVLMIKTGLGAGWDRTFLKALLLLYINGFLLGGVMEHFRQYVRTGSLFFALAVLGYSLSLGIWRLLTCFAERKARYCQVRLLRKGHEYETEALVDTGNRLRDPVTGKSVSVISTRAAGALGICLPSLTEAGGRDYSLKEEDLKHDSSRKEDGLWQSGFWYIPYHSVGRAEGVMPAVMLDALYVPGNPVVQIENPVVAVCEEYITEDDYEMLLNPDLL